MAAGLSVRRAFVALCGLGMLAGASGEGRAQSPFSPFTQAGFVAGRDLHTVFPYEHVDPASGGLVLVQTDLVLPGPPGFDLVVARTYSSKVHPRYEAGDVTLEERSWLGVGWRLHFGRVIRPDALEPGATLVETGDGARQPLYRTTAFPEGWMTRSFARYDRATHTLKAPTGLVYTFGHLAAPTGLLGAVRYVTEIRDPFGNRVTFTYAAPPAPPGALARITQELGNGQVREVTFTLDPGTNALAAMSYQGQTWTFQTRAANVAGHAQLMGTQRPTGLTRWQYDYDQTLPGGELTLLQAPGGGQVGYVYGDRLRAVGSRQVRTRVVTERRTAAVGAVPGTWTFAYSQGPNQDTTVVTTPCGTETSRFTGMGLVGPFPAWTSGLLVERTVQQGGQTLERETRSYRQSDVLSADPIPGEPDGSWGDPAVYAALLEEQVVTRGPQSWRTTYRYRNNWFFNDYGQPWEVRAYPETGGEPLYRAFDYQYGFAPWIVGRVAGVTTQLGAGDVGTDTFTYDLTTGFLTRQTVRGVTTTFEPTPQGNVGAIVDALGRRTTLTYSWGVVSRIQTPLLTTTRTINPAGTVATETVGAGPAALTTAYTYDALGRLGRIDPPSTAQLPVEPTWILYDATHNRSYTVRHGPLTGPSFDTTIQLDGFGRPVRVVDPAGVAREVDRDACGRETWASRPFTSGPAPSGWQTTYDALGRVTQVVDTADGSTTTTSYTGIDQTVTDAAGRVTRSDYLAFGDPAAAQLVAVTDADLKITRYTWNRLGQLTSVTGPGTADVPGPTRTWTIDPVTGRVLRETQPESGTTTYEYDAVGNRTRQTDALGQVVSFTYDANDRLIGRDAPGTGADLALEYDALGRRWRQTAGGVVTTWGFDAVGRLASRADALDGRTFTSTYTADRFNRVTELTLPRPAGVGRRVGYVYGGAGGRLSLVTQNGATFASGFTYDGGGRLVAYDTGPVRHAVTVDARERPARLTVGPVGAPALDLTYSYSRVSEVLGITDARAGQSQAFGYDVLGRLREATGPWGTLEWTYDAEGNRTTERRGGALSTYSYHAATRRLASVSGATAEAFTWDALGRLTQDGRGSYAYLPTSQLATVTTPTTTVQYRYDPEGWRIARTVGGATTYTLRGPDSQPLSQYAVECGTLVWLRDEIYAAGRRLGAVRRGATTVTVALASAASSVGEGAGTASVGVRVTTSDGTPLVCPVSVTYHTADGTATAGADYTARSGTVTFAGGTPSGTVQTVAVPIVNDGVDEANESFSITLSAPSGATLAAPTTHVVTIVDDDPPPVLSVSGGTASEGTAAATFTVTLAGATARTVQVSYATTDGTALVAAGDYTARSGTLSFAPGQPTSQTVVVPVATDAWAEPTETVGLVLSGPVNATIGSSTGWASIADDDGTYRALDLAREGVYLADAHGGPGVDDYVLLGNPHDVPMAVRLTTYTATGAAVQRDLTLAARTRADVWLAGESGVGGQGPVSVAVQSLTAGRAVDAEHAAYWGSGWQGGRSSEGAAPASTWYFAEGSIGYFEEYLTVFNLEPQAVAVTFDFYPPSGAVVTRTVVIAAGPGRLRVRLRDWLGVLDHGTRVTATRLDTGAAARIVAERTMEWESADRREGHSTPGVAALSPTWHFAEGSSPAFDTYLALLNPTATAATATVSYRHETGAVYTASVPVPARSRATLLTPSWVPGGSYGISVVSSGPPLAVERMLYGGTAWTVGTAGVGAPAGATTWRLTEGAVGWFDTYLLLLNLGTQATTATVTFDRASGGSVTAMVGVPAGGRATLTADLVPGLTGAFRATVTSPQPIVVERASYWPGVVGSSALLSGGGETAVLTGALLARRPVDGDQGGGGGGGAGGPTLARGAVSPARGACAVGCLAYQELAAAVPVGPVSEARAAGLVSAEEVAARAAAMEVVGEGVVPAGEAAAPGGEKGAVGGGGVVLASGSLPWYGGHVTLGRRP